MIEYAGRIKGLGHTEVQDAAATADCGHIHTAVVCDGASCCKGAKAAAEALADHLAKYAAQHYGQMEKADDEHMREMLIHEIRRVQLRLSDESGMKMAEFGSTLLLLAVNTVTQEHIVVTLGDGLIVGVRSGGGVAALMQPEKGENGPHATYLTVHSDDVLQEHLHIYRGGLYDGGYVLMSDGFECSMYASDGSDVNTYVVELLHQLTLKPEKAGRDFMRSMLWYIKPFDDCSIVCVVPGAPHDDFFVTHSLVRGRSKAAMERIDRYKRYILLRERGKSQAEAARQVWPRGSDRHVSRLAEYGLA